MGVVAVVALVPDCNPVHPSSGIRLPTGAEMDVLATNIEIEIPNPMNEGGAEGITCSSKNTRGTRSPECRCPNRGDISHFEPTSEVDVRELPCSSTNLDDDRPANFVNTEKLTVVHRYVIG